MLVLVPGTQGGAGGITPVARDIVRARAAHAGVDRRPPRAGVRGHVGVPERRPAGGAGLLPRLQVQARARRRREVRRRLGPAASARRPAQRGAPRGQRAAGAGDPRRPLGGRLDGGGLRGVGLRRAPGLPRHRRARADRRRTARAASPRPTSTRAKRELADIRTGKVFLDLLGIGIPEISGIFAQVGALWAYKRPDEPSALQEFPLLPAIFKPPIHGHERGASSATRSTTTPRPEALELIHVRAGRLADARRPARLAVTASSRRSGASRRPTRPTSRTRPSGTTRAACCSTSTPPAR